MRAFILVSLISLILSGCASGGSSQEDSTNTSSQVDVLLIGGECWYQVDANGDRKLHTESIKWIQNGSDIIGRFYPQSTRCEEGTPGINQVAGTISSQDRAFYIELSSARNYCGGRYYQTYEGELTGEIIDVDQRYFYTKKNCLSDDSLVVRVKYKRIQ